MSSITGMVKTFYFSAVLRFHSNKYLILIQVPDNSCFNNDSIFVGLFFDLHWISDWCDTHSNDIFENSWPKTTRRLDGYHNRIGMFIEDNGTSVRWLRIYELWHLRNIWFYYCDDGCRIAMAVDF